ncbi:hypothetical protein FRT60_22780 [Pseudomonas haemolytica]|uniref:Uncharacterized protein n=1 Tax=Pseudomonas haemolytica TaxID=2600065 RepID=A0A5P1DKY8_9PSED|nr:hypothetical protein [Pseudomonas haemolytica]MRJ40530.1 hypothetical protein [Pseudomonas haemolytica]
MQRPFYQTKSRKNRRLFSLTCEIARTIGSPNEPNNPLYSAHPTHAFLHGSPTLNLTTRHLADLLEKNCLIRLPAGGRSTRYQINPTYE